MMAIQKIAKIFLWSTRKESNHESISYEYIVGLPYTIFEEIQYVVP